MIDFTSIINKEGLLIGGERYAVISDGFYYASTVDKYYIYSYLHHHEIILLRALLSGSEHPNIIAYNIDNLNQKFVIKRDGITLYHAITESDTTTSLTCFVLWDIEDSSAWLIRQDKLAGLLSNENEMDNLQ